MLTTRGSGKRIDPERVVDFALTVANHWQLSVINKDHLGVGDCIVALERHLDYLADQLDFELICTFIVSFELLRALMCVERESSS